MIFFGYRRVGTDGAVVHSRASAPTWIATTPAPISPIAAFYDRLLMYYRWTTVFILFDQNSFGGYYLVLAGLMRKLDVDRGFQVRVASVNTRKSTDFSKELKDFKFSGRGMLSPSFASGQRYGLDAATSIVSTLTDLILQFSFLLVLKTSCAS